MKKTIFFYFSAFVFAVLISIPLIIPYLHPGFFPTHDGQWAVVRLSDMFREIRDFQIPPRYSGNLNFGYGYPLFNFTYPLPYYLGLMVHFLGFGFVDSIKFLFAASVPLSAFFMFLASEKIWKNTWAGIISSVLYIYFPYRLVDLFVRGSIGESIAFVFFPIILYCLSHLIENPRSVGFKIIGTISYALLILSHNIMAVLFTLSLVVFFTGNFVLRKYKILKVFLFVGFFGYVLSAFFWIPALLEKHNIALSKIPIADRNLYFVSIKQLLFSPWGYGVPTDKLHGFTYQLGWPFFIVIFLAIGVFVYKIYTKDKFVRDQIIAISLLLGSAALSFFLFSPSSLLWKLPFLSEINYPWTMLSQLGLLLSLLAGYLTKFKYTKALVFSALVVALFLYIPQAKPASFIDKGDSYYFTNDATTTSSNELMPIWVKKLPFERLSSKVEIVKGQGSIENITYNSKLTSFTAELAGSGIVRLNTIYYPGWEVLVNDRRQKISYDNEKGVMDIALPKGRLNIIAKFSETPTRAISNIISFAGLIFMFALLIKSLPWRKNENTKK